jgi:exopolyphosphatase/guanosine-5'-triphosphate,3'-diphosphate pyrophosphatase
LTVAEARQAEGTRALEPLLESARITRLGEGVDRSRRLAEAAAERTLACLGDYGEELQKLGVTRLEVVGTSALRDAGGGPEFIERAAGLLGTRPRVIGGQEEAELTFWGALSGLPVAGPVTVFDVGGGSTELIHGSSSAAERRLDFATSLDLGSVRLFERYGASDPPSEQELARARSDIESALASVPGPPRGNTLVGVAGTVTTLSAVAQRLATYDPAAVHGSRLSAGAAHAIYDELRRLPLSERRELPGLEPARADVIVFGAVLVCSILSWSRAPELIVSDRGVRWGLLERMAAELGPA